MSHPRNPLMEPMMLLLRMSHPRNPLMEPKMEPMMLLLRMSHPRNPLMEPMMLLLRNSAKKLICTNSIFIDGTYDAVAKKLC